MIKTQNASSEPLFLTQSNTNPGRLNIPTRPPALKGILHTPNIKHFFAKYLASDDDEYNTLYKILNLEINCDSPKTKQVMANSGIRVDDLIIQPYDNFLIKYEAEEISQVRYQSHLQTVACARLNLVKERKRLEKWEMNNSTSKREMSFFSSVHGRSKIGKKKLTNLESLSSPPPNVDIEYHKLENKIKRMKKKQENMKKQIEKEALLLMEEELKSLKTVDDEKTKVDKILQAKAKELEAKRKLAQEHNLKTMEKVKEHKRLEKNKALEERSRKKQIYEREEEKQKELFQSHQEKMARQYARASEEETKKQESCSKRAFTLREEELEIENMKMAREFKEARVTRHFQIEKDLMRKHVIEKVKKFQEKISKINEDKEKNDQEKINSIMDKYYKTQDNLLKHLTNIEKNRKEIQKKGLLKQEKLKENMKRNRNYLKETTKSIVEKNQDKLQKAEMSRLDRDEFFFQRAEQNRERMRKISENNIYSSLEKKRKCDEIMERNKSISNKINKMRKDYELFLAKTYENNIETKQQKEILFSTIQTLHGLKNSEIVLRKLKKMNLSVDSLEKMIKEPIPEENPEQQQQQQPTK